LRRLKYWRKPRKRDFVDGGNRGRQQAKGIEKGYEEAKSQYEDLIQEAELIRENALKEYQETLQVLKKMR